MRLARARTTVSLLAGSVALALLAAAPAAAEDGGESGPEDAAISTRVHRELERAGFVQEDVRVRVEEGVVTLSGHVPTPSDREKAASAAHRAEGVKEVVNELAVGQLDTDALPPVGSDVPSIE